MMELNKIHNMDWLNNTLPDKCAGLMICDPPYYKVKGDFDFIWKTFDDYLKDVEKWAIECKRILADNGTLFWYGDRKRIAYSQIILDRYLNLEENITIHIFDRQTNKIRPEDATSFINVTESLLMYSNEVGKTGLQEIYDNSNLFLPIKEYMRNEKARLKQHNKSVNDIYLRKLCGVSLKGGGLLSHYFGNAQWQLPTEKHYKKLQTTGYWQKPYEALRQEYEALRRPFNIQEKYKTNILRISQEGHKTGKYKHDTIKPEKLTRILITACSRKNDLIVIPFSGSGTECAMSAKEGRTFIGFDIKQKHVETSNKRCNLILSQTSLFGVD